MTDTIADGLKPCPFCGDSAVMSYCGEYSAVLCTNCNVKTADRSDEAKAVEDWNTRTPAVPAESVGRVNAYAAIAATPPAGRVEELEQRLRALHEALTPSAETKAAYISEFSFTIEEGEYGSRIILVPWTTIKEIMAAIIGRAALSGEGR